MKVEHKLTHRLLFDMKCDASAFATVLTLWFNGDEKRLVEFLEFLDQHDLQIGVKNVGGFLVKGDPSHSGVQPERRSQ